MTEDPQNKSIQQRYRHLYSLISSKRFQQKTGLGNEVPFFICPYPPKEALEMVKMIKSLVNKLEQANVRILEIDLYEMAVSILQKKGIWQRVLEIEKTVTKEQIKELLQGVLDPETHLVPEIAEKMREKEFDVMFITGVGEVYPYIRSHNLLNNLQGTAKKQPTVMFFPGSYTHTLENGASLDLFEKLHDDKYYRAFNIYHCEV